MVRRPTVSRTRLRWLAAILLAVSCLVSGPLVFTHLAFADNSSNETLIGSDSFDRANGPLGAGWTDDSDGGLSIVSDQVAGNGGNSGDIRTAESYPSDQFSQLVVGSTQLSGGEWIGPAVRMQDNGQSAYVGFYFWNSGSPVLMLFLRHGGNWKQLGSTYNSGALAAGTQLQVTAVGSTISLLENGVVRVTATDSNVSGGAPGILASGAATAGAWSGGSVGSGGSAYSVGGTVSGLSGTVVLQDNGSDSLSVTANGSFTFATQLASGAAYAVTVQSYPSGQTCTVSDGSGTVSSANVTNVAISCATAGSGGGPGPLPGETLIGSDGFNRANGALGAGWTDDSDGGLSIVSDQVVGNGGNSGDLRTGESYPSDQFSQLVVGSTQLSGGQWIGPAVRMQASGQSGYVGFYYANNGGGPVLMLFLRNGGNWKQLGNTYNSGALAAGTQLQVTAVGSTISLLENGVVRVT
ncbi:MAG TPA: hypothetical protein VK784_01740, partial [Pseudonocardiaceae bacterium]|nr:hypothetical protein [Pseudonocardiaceae bacterium]